MKNFVVNFLILLENALFHMAKSPMLNWARQEKQGGGGTM
jgi:hypothetical protein